MVLLDLVVYAVSESCCKIWSLQKFGWERVDNKKIIGNSKQNNDEINFVQLLSITSEKWNTLCSMLSHAQPVIQHIRIRTAQGAPL